MAVGKRLRFEVFKRDGFQCQYCGRTPPQVVLEPDHVVPVSDGGPDAMENLVAACFDCNRGKSNIPLTSVPRPLAEVMEEAAERREQLEAYNQMLLDQRAAEEERIAELGRHWFNRLVRPKDYGKWVFGHDRAQSIRTFLRKLPAAVILEAMDAAHARKNATLEYDEPCWKYFCGICWNKARELEG